MPHNIPTKAENPDGFHQRFRIERLDGRPVDPNAEYFVLRLDAGGRDTKHINACRAAIGIYADLIASHIPGLAKDLHERYAPNVGVCTLTKMSAFSPAEGHEWTQVFLTVKSAEAAFKKAIEECGGDPEDEEHMDNGYYESDDGSITYILNSGIIPEI